MSLKDYHQKRDFKKTSEPRGLVQKRKNKSLEFVIQKHAASRLHYDFRLELNGVLKSWAIPKGPSLNPLDKRLAVHVEDHPLDYKDFEGIIPKGQYGGGTVLLWDVGRWIPEGDPEKDYKKGKLKFRLEGNKLKGKWLLFKMSGRAGEKENWLLVKEKDAFASKKSITEEKSQSVQTGCSLEEIAQERDRVWQSNKGSSPKKIIKKDFSINLPANAKKRSFPGFVKPQLATLSDEVPQGADWIHEIKLDGYRMIASVNNGKTTLYTRSKQNWTHKFSSIAKALEKIPVQQILLDGEIVQLLPNGTSNFQALQNALSEKKTDSLHYYVFDLLYLNGYDLSSCSLQKRRELLQDILQQFSSPIVRFNESIQTDPKEFYKKACEVRLEGIISKRKDLPYASGRSQNWIKVKCSHRQELIICGYTEPAGSRQLFGALLLAYYDSSKQLRYAGLVGTGFSVQSIQKLHSQLLKIQQTKPVVKVPAILRRKKIHWVRPELVAEIEFTEWTKDKVMRHPSFEGLREDKKAAEVKLEIPTSTDIKKTENVKPPKEKKSQSKLASVQLSHPTKILFPDQGITKQDLADYYEEISSYILPHIYNRPLSLLRCPAGAEKKCFYQKHLSKGEGQNLNTISIQEKNGKDIYLMANSMEGLKSLVQMGVLEIHPWGTQANHIEKPDRMIFDLDPDLGMSWKKVVDAAKMLSAFLLELKLKNFLKTTGGKGLHIVVPLSPVHSWDIVKDFSKKIAETLAESRPKDFTSEMLKVKRKGKIFIDYLRNARGATAIAPYSTRARSGAAVATPLFWEELDPKLKSDHFNIKNLPKRLASLKEDPWKDLQDLEQTLPTL